MTTTKQPKDTAMSVKQIVTKKVRQSVMAMALTMCSISLPALAQNYPTMSGGDTVALQTNNGPVQPFRNIVISDPDNIGIISATVSITANYQIYQDDFWAMGYLNYNFDRSTGVMTINTPGTAADYQNFLQSLYFYTNTQGPDRTIKVSLTKVGATFNADNEHFYKVFNYNNAGSGWGDQVTFAASTSYRGMQGYLATITSQQEADYISQNMPGYYYVGANDIDNEGTWRWKTGPEGLEDGGLGRPFSQGDQPINSEFVRWESGEPNGGTGENYLVQYEQGTWNDAGDNSGSNILVEYGGMPGDALTTISGDSVIEISSTVQVNSGITAVTLDNTTIDEYVPIGTAVGALSSTSVNYSTNFTYTFASGAGDTDNGLFSLDLNKLQVAATMDFRDGNRHVRIRTTDEDGNYYEDTLAIAIAHVRGTASDFNRRLSQDSIYHFTTTDFSDAFTIPDGIGVLGVTISSLPDDGQILSNGDPIIAGQGFWYGDIANVTYVPSSPSFYGPVTFSYHVYDMLGTPTADATVTIYVGKKRAIEFTSIQDLNFDSTSLGGFHYHLTSASSALDSIYTGGGHTTPGTTTDPGLGMNKTSGIGEAENVTVANHCFPNPFTQSINIQYELSVDAKVSVKVYNLLGMEVADLVNITQATGSYQVNWNGESNMGLPFETGNYFYKIMLQDAAGKTIGNYNGRMVKF